MLGKVSKFTLLSLNRKVGAMVRHSEWFRLVSRYDQSFLSLAGLLDALTANDLANTDECRHRISVSIVGCLYAIRDLFVLERINLFEFRRDGVIFVVVFAEEQYDRLASGNDCVFL